jgi:RNA polymerase sigma factor (sigma-70 family)
MLMAEYGTRLRTLAKRMNDHKASLDVNDLVQVGLLGLIEAWHVFDREENNDFWLYAYARVRGAMVDELRAMRQFSRRVGRQFHMERYVPEVHDVPVDPTPDASPRCWADYLGDLPERERQIVGLYIVRELALHRIGKLYGFSESRAAQIVTKALKTLRGNMQ